MSESMQSFSKMMALGRTLTVDQVPEQSRQSLPVPVPAREDRPLRVAFMFCPAQALPGVTRMAPPNQIAWLDPHSGALLGVRPVTPASFGQSHPPREPLGEFRLAQGVTAESYLALRERLFQLYDLLFPIWAGQASAPEQARWGPSARELLQIFGQVGEPPLIPYYYSLGKDFFDWMRALAR
jgi:hypothetical protein